jgi:hypothetical protein
MKLGMKSKIVAKRARLIAGGLLGAIAASSALAQEASTAQGLLDNSFVLNVGAFIVGSDTTASLRGQASTGTDVDFDKSFGKPADASRVRVDALWRINPKHHLRFMYFDNDVTRSKGLSQDINWGDYTYKVGANVESEVKTTVYELAYEYAFMRAPSYEIAASAGLHYSEFSMRLSGTATFTDANGNVSSASFTNQSNTVAAPLPVIGVRGGWVVSPSWYLDAQAQFFRIKVDGIDGTWTDLKLGATWMFSRHYGVGLGYNSFTTKVDIDRPGYSGSLTTGYSGVLAYLTGTF